MLQSVEWDKVTIDVVCVEVEQAADADLRGGAVGQLLEERGFAWHSHVEPNAWFVRRGFAPSVNPDL